MSSVDWNVIKREYEAGGTSLTDLAKKHGIPPGTVRCRKKREGWQDPQRNAATQQRRVATDGSAEPLHDGQPAVAQSCGAKTRAGTPCAQPAGWGTDHIGRGRCKLHGGRSPGGPPGNKKALLTGEYETIWLDTLDPDEVELYHTIQTDKLAQLDTEIRLLEIRERRMMQRIQKLKEHDFTIVECESEEGEERGQPTGLTRQKRLATLGQIQAIEEALTRVQAQKARLLDLRHKFESSEPPNIPNLQEYIRALEGAAEDVWADGDGEGDET